MDEFIGWKKSAYQWDGKKLVIHYSMNLIVACVSVCVCLESIILHQQNFDIYMWDMNNNNGIDDNNKMIFVIQILFRNNNGPEGL